MEKNLNFETIGSSAKRTLRPINPDRIASDVSFELEKSEGVRPSVAFMPHRFSPSIKTIHTVTNEDFGIAIPKGTIVGGIPVVSKEAYIDGFEAPGSGTPVIETTDTASGQQVVGVDFEGNNIYASTDNPLFGYGKVINAAVIANGGDRTADLYTAYDVATERQLPDGSLVTITDSFVRGANIPLGIAHEDIYINREGQYLNASETAFQLFDSVLADYFIAVPYVVNGGAVMSATVTNSVDAAGVQTMSAAYAAIYAQGIACLIAEDRGDVFTLGNAVMSDNNGKFIPQFTEVAIEAAGTYVGNLSTTLQTVGRIFAVDNKFPKDLIDTVQNYPYNHSGGTATYGLPLELYRLVYYVFTGAGIAITYDNIINAVNSGEFGIVYINLHVN